VWHLFVKQQTRLESLFVDQFDLLASSNKLANNFAGLFTNSPELEVTRGPPVGPPVVRVSLCVHSWSFIAYSCIQLLNVVAAETTERSLRLSVFVTASALSFYNIGSVTPLWFLHLQAQCLLTQNWLAF
jgi:hypothetical protein